MGRSNNLKQDRTAPRTASDIERKYSFGKKFAEMLGLINDTREDVTSVESTLRDEITETATSITRNTEQIVLEAKQTTKQEIQEEIEQVEEDLTQKIENIDGTFFYVKYSAYADGSVMTDTPEDTTLYMGTCSTNQSTAPTDHTEYTWVRVRGDDGEDGVPGEPGVDGRSSFFHVKYSPVENPTAEQMTETPSAYIGTYVDYIEADSEDPSDYKWVRMEGIDGADGIPGQNGENGKTSYLHIAYSNSEDGTVDFSVSDSAGKRYLGQYHDFIEDDSTNPEDYSWTLIKGEDGQDGVPGTPGADGKTSYFHVKYSEVENPTSSQMLETPSTYIGTYVDFIEEDSTDPTKYKWTKFEGHDGADGIPGTNGIDGSTSYIHIAYADSPDGMTNFSVSDSEGKYYIGQYHDFIEEDSLDPTKYSWTLIKGADGKDGKDGTSVRILGSYASEAELREAHPTAEVGDGYIINGDLYVWCLEQNDWQNVGTIQGESGADGKTSYLHTAYANSADGTTDFSITDPTGRQYLGQYVDFTEPDSTDPSKYKWVLIKGEAGTPGEPGADGRTSYLHIKYSDDGQTFTANNGEELGAWIGTLVDFNEADSLNFSDYTWKKFTEDVDEELNDIRKIITEQEAYILTEAEGVTIEALKNYVETSTYDEYREDTAGQLKVMSDNIAMNFTSTSEAINRVDGEVERKFTELYKHIAFNEDGITIGGSSGITLTIDNDEGIIFKQGDRVFGRWDGNNFLTGNIDIRVDERAKLGNFAFVPRSDGSLMFLKVGE